MRPISLSILLLALLCFLSSGISAEPAGLVLQVGTAMEDITPPPGLPMAGYAARKDPAIGNWDTLFARTLVFDDGQTQAALVTLDLLYAPPRPIRAAIMEAAQSEWGIDHVIFIASHTHSGPRFNLFDPNEDLPWLKTLHAKILSSIQKANGNKVPVTLQYAEGELNMSYDRRLVNADGTVTMLFSNPDRLEPTKIDQAIRILQMVDPEKKPVATLVHYACHPVMFGGGNLKYSAEFPGVMKRHVEEQTGGMCFFMQGACGNVNPYNRASYDDEGYQALVAEGKQMGDEVLRALQTAKPIEEASPRITVLHPQTQLDFRYDPTKPEVREYYIKSYGAEYVDTLYKHKPKELIVETPILMIGRQVAWAGFPGEFFNEFQVDLTSRSPVPHTFFLGYCNDNFSYFPTIKAAAEGGYGASNATDAEVGAGERLVDNVIIQLYTQLGHLPPLPH
ncbi:MAG: neutral/alkaline non-lysosomal ceramidase N-terminal domain-containing protein [bacterium]|nr:neutral/alkaline non-lysosomal ceramidase N-terminal domain-containing protein [bacterium]